MMASTNFLGDIFLLTSVNQKTTWSPKFMVAPKKNFDTF